MAIFYKESDHTITIQTKSTTYQMKIDEIGVVLHTYYGSRIEEEDLSYSVLDIGRGFTGNPYEKGKTDRSYSLETKPLEYSGFGVGDYRSTPVRIRHANGTQVLDLRYEGHDILKGKYTIPGLPAAYDDEDSAQTLVVRLQDEAAGIGVTMLYGVFEDYDIITRSVMITNFSEEVKYVEKAASMSLDFVGNRYDLMTFHGKWARERIPERRPVPFGTTSIGSVRGGSSPNFNPSAILLEKDADEDVGRAYGFAFVYSGEFLLEAEMDPNEQTRVMLGIHPDDFCWELKEDETFAAPEVIMTMSAEGISGVSNRMHEFIRKHIVRGPWRDFKRPVLINNWEGTYFDFNGDKLVSMAKDAAELGIDMFVLDDGWFGKRDDDNSGLGDWYPNEKKLGCTMAELGERIRATGLRFGIWFEPEAINEDSDLYRAHPEWVVMVPGRKPCLGRNELLLDLGREDVQNYLIDCMTKVIREGGVSYVKWDFNRSLCDKYSALLPAERMGEMAHRFVLGTYRVLETLRSEFPDLLIEGCSSGGGRFDCGMLYYTPQIWCSDDTDPMERLWVQYGTSFIYPVNTMGAHVSASPNHQTGRRTPMETRAAVAMSGTFGYELDINKMSDEERMEIRREIKAFHELYDVLQYGNYYRLQAPSEETCTVWEQAAKDGSRAVVTAVYHYVQANQVMVYVRLKGLDPNRKYRISLVDERGLERLTPMQKNIFSGEMSISGRALMERGLYIPEYKKEYQSWQILLTAE